MQSFFFFLIFWPVLILHAMDSTSCWEHSFEILVHFHMISSLQTFQLKLITVNLLYSHIPIVLYLESFTFTVFGSHPYPEWLLFILRQDKIRLNCYLYNWELEEHLILWTANVLCVVCGDIYSCFKYSVSACIHS